MKNVNKNIFSSNTYNMQTIVFDTETTGLPLNRYSSIYKTNEWPYIIQLSYMVYDENTHEIISDINDYILIDDKIEITNESYEKHGITRVHLKENGIPIVEALTKFKKYMESCHVVVGHNVSFDKRMVLVECIRHKIQLNMKETFCTMKNSVDLCQFEAKNKEGETYYKYPKLEELHYYLFSHNIKNLHDASVDILVCLRCYIKIIYDIDITKKNSHVNTFIKSLKVQ